MDKRSNLVSAISELQNFKIELFKKLKVRSDLENQINDLILIKVKYILKIFKTRYDVIKTNEKNYIWFNKI